MTLTQGQIIQSRYRVVALLGQGGFGAVYKGWDINLNKHVAIKENLDTSSEAQRQFQHEAQILSSLSHPNLPRVIDHFLIPGAGQYLVMDFVEGDDLQTLLDKTGRPLPDVAVLAWIEQVCDALAYLHTQSAPIIHRDVKPANIKITPQGKAVLVDFGISKVYDPQLKTTVGARAVTPGYSPLEQYGQGTTDPRSDIYALGATLYVLLTGQELQESVQRVLVDQVRAAHQVNPQVPPAISEAIQRALAVNPTGRYQTAGEFKAAIVTAAQKAMGERVEGLYRQATAAVKQNDFDNAEASLQQVLALDPNHARARALLNQINQRRDVMHRYRALANTIAQARVEAESLRQIDPALADPDRVLQLLGSRARSSSPVLPTPVVPPSPPVKISAWPAWLVILGAIAAAVIGGAIASEAMRDVLASTASLDLGNGNFDIGLGAGLQLSALLLLNLFVLRSRFIRIVVSGLVLIGAGLMVLGLSMANIAARSVPATMASVGLGNGNFLMGLGLGAGVSGIVMLWLAWRGHT